ncbi:MAG: transcriptional regulator, partial [Gorillibacterium sp.]|nr:transcriptional regulator [Gorillibacterium sp.]
MKLSKAMAQKIAEEMMKVIPYNINVMDADGVIIGSGDRRRIGTFHEGARIAITTGKINEVYEQGGGMKPGVNEPIVMNHLIIGVVGITGDPDEVRPFSQLMKVTVVLLIEQAIANEREQDERVRIERFYHELAYRKANYDQAFLERAKRYELDLTKRCRVMLIKGKVDDQAFKNAIPEYTHLWMWEQDKAVVFLSDPLMVQALVGRLENCKEVKAIGIGEEEDFAATSLEQATAALELGAKLAPTKKVNA